MARKSMTPASAGENQRASLGRHWALSLCLPFLFAHAASAAVLASYGFNGNANDSSGNGYNLVANGSPAYTNGDCDGTSTQEYGPVTDTNDYSEGSPFLSSFSNLGAFSVSFYFDATSLADQPVLLSWTTAAGTWNFLQILSGGGISLDQNGMNILPATPVITTGTCHYVVLSQSGGTATLWVDGAQIGTLNDGGGTGALTALTVGAWANGTGYAFDGTLEDLTFSNAAYAPTPTVTPTPGAGPIRVACVGASITFGYCSNNPAVDSYPAVLQTLLGSGYQVQNDGDSGAGILKLGQEPYWYSSQYYNALAFNPNIVIIDLGANDTKPVDWQYNANIAADYVALVNLFRNLPSHPTVYMSLPCWVETPNYGITEDIVAGYLLPEMIQIGNQQNLCMIDMFDALQNQTQYYCTDGVHLNDTGYAYMAQVMYNAITQKTACYEPVTPIPTATPTSLGTPSETWRVNAGGPAFTDTTGNLWSADCDYVGGTPNATAAAIAGTANQTLYKTERQGDVITYAFPMEPWDYQVTLKFAETDGDGTGQRQQNVYINGNQVLTNFDCYSQVGADAADDQVYNNVGTNALGQIFVQLGVPTSGQSQICAIQIVPEAQTPTQTPTFTQTPTATLSPTPYSCPQSDAFTGGAVSSFWSSADIGGAGPSTQVVSAGSLSVTTASGDIQGTGDSFHYTFQGSDQDVDARLKVNFTAAASNAKSGLMFRSSTEAGDVDFYIAATNSCCNYETGYRTFIGDVDNASGSGTYTSGANPGYVRITRVGDTFTSYTSTNGATWTQAVSVTVPMASSYVIGICTSSGNGSESTANYGPFTVSCTGPVATPTPTTPIPATPTLTRTRSPTAGPSGTPTRSPSETLTSTETSSASPSGTPTRSPSETLTVTETGTSSASPSGTPTRSPSETPAVTETGTSSASPSGTPTRSPSETLTVTETGTSNASPSATASSSGTLTRTPSETLTASGTSSPTVSQSVTPSESSSPTPSLTFSGTSSPSPNPSGTPTLTGTPAAGPTRTATPDSTSAASTPPSGSGPGKIIMAEPVPNPDPTSLAVELEGSCPSLTIQIYTEGMTLVDSWVTPAEGPGWVRIPLSAQTLALPAGTFYDRISPGNSGHAVVGRLVMLR